MRVDEVSAILARVQLDDNRDIDDEGVVLKSWIETIGDLPFDLAWDAVVTHRRESTEYLTVGHIRANVRLARGRLERDARIAAEYQRLALPAPQIILDRVAFDNETRLAIEAHRAGRATA